MISDRLCLHQNFERQAAQTPDAIGIRCDGHDLTYRQLNERANQLAHFLKRFGVGPETPVALCLERSPEMIIAILGVLKAGGAYVPTDLAYPGRVTLFEAIRTTNPSPAPIWRKLAHGGIDVRRIETTHEKMLDSPYVELLAKEFNNCLEACNREESKARSA